MRRKQLYLLLGVVAAIAGCSAQAAENGQAAAGPGELIVRVDQDAVRAFVAPDRQVHVVGMAKVSVPPDVADLWIGVSIVRQTALEAVGANNQAMTSLIEAIKQQGVAPKDIQTSHISISPQYSPAKPPGAPLDATVPKVVGYEVTNTIQVTTRDLARIGLLLDMALKAGSNQLQGLAFRLDNQEAVKADLRAKALDDAKKKAELYATRSGMVLGPVTQITEADAGWTPAASAPAAYADVAAPVAPTMPVNPGDQDVSLSVSVSYELKLPK
jgi:uncharacterized protein